MTHGTMGRRCGGVGRTGLEPVALCLRAPVSGIASDTIEGARLPGVPLPDRWSKSDSR